MNWLLVIATFLGGASPGPVVHTQPFATQKQCEAAAAAVLAQVDEMTKTNMTGPGQTAQGITAMGRHVVTARCTGLK